MRFEDGNYLTVQGRELMAKLIAAKGKIKYTRAAVGTGTVPEGATPQDMTNLAEWKVEGIISDVSTPVPGEAHVTFQVFSQDVDIGFLATEAAIWAEDPDGGEVLYTYIVIANTPEWIRAKTDAVQKFAEFTSICLISSATVDKSEINPEAIATLAYLKRRLNAFLELSENENPSEGTRVHLFTTATIEDWYAQIE